MRRVVALWVVLLGAFAVSAQTGSEVLRTVSEKVGAIGAYRIDFELTMAGAEKPSEGYCVVDGEKYLIAIEDLKQGCDGTTLWMLNGANREVTLDRPNTESRSLFDNPTRAFDFAEELFDVVSFEELSATVWRLVLRPAEGVLDGIESVVLEVSRATKLPTLLGYDMGGVGLFVRIDNFAPTTPSEREFAQPEEEGFEVIDFR